MKRFALPVFVAASLVSCATHFSPDPVYRETEVRQARPRLDGEKFDPQEADPRLMGAFSSADRKAERAVGGVTRDAQFITHFWDAKRRILSEEFGIAWRTPAELNPQIKYASYGQAEITAVETQVLQERLRSMKSPTERINLIERDFDGHASVFTFDPNDDTGRRYRFIGHDNDWTFVDVFRIED